MPSVSVKMACHMRSSVMPVLWIHRIHSAPHPRLTSSGAGRTVAETIITLGKAFNMTTLAEGVETLEQFELLANLGCDQSQGYLHSRPLAAADLEPLLKPALTPSPAQKSNGANHERTATAHGG